VSGRPPIAAGWLVVGVHDVAPATAAETRRWCADLDRRGVPASLLVVAGPWREPVLGRGSVLARLTVSGDEPGSGSVLDGDPRTDLVGRPEDGSRFVAWLRGRVAGGDEMVLHGWEHRAVPGGSGWRRAFGRLVARGAAEFAAMGEDEAYARLAAGRFLLDELGLPPIGVTPPGWLASPGTVRAMRRLGFRYTTTHRGLLDLRTGSVQRAFALSHRPGGAGERLGATVLGVGARIVVRRGGTLRLALHPADLHRPGLREATLRAVDRALDCGLRPVTYRTWLETVVPEAP
jgi:uncharacterized protein